MRQLLIQYLGESRYRIHLPKDIALKGNEKSVFLRLPLFKTKSTNNNPKLHKTSWLGFHGRILYQNKEKNLKKNSNKPNRRGRCLRFCPFLNTQIPFESCIIRRENEDGTVFITTGCRRLYNVDENNNEIIVVFPGVIPIYTENDPFIIEGADLFFIS